MNSPSTVRVVGALQETHLIEAARAALGNRVIGGQPYPASKSLTVLICIKIRQLFHSAFNEKIGGKNAYTPEYRNIGTHTISPVLAIMTGETRQLVPSSRTYMRNDTNRIVTTPDGFSFVAHRRWRLVRIDHRPVVNPTTSTGDRVFCAMGRLKAPTWPKGVATSTARLLQWKAVTFHGRFSRGRLPAQNPLFAHRRDPVTRFLNQYALPNSRPRLW